MLTALTAPVRYSVTERRLVTAFGISVAAHLVLFGFVRLAPAMASRMFAPVIAAVMPAQSAAARKAEEARKAQEAKKEAERQARKEAQQAALTFVDVDPALAVLDAPKTPKYYSSKSTVAANPDFQKTTAAPKLDGNQVHVPRLADVPRVQPKPLQPSPRPEPPEESARPVPETPASKPAPAPQRPVERAGDLAMVRPAERTPPAEPRQTPRFSTGTTAAGAADRPRPRTLAAAYEQNPRLAGQRMKQDGGVARRGRVSVDAAASPFGDYDREFIETVEHCWFSLLEDRSFMTDKRGKVVVDFRLYPDGRVTETMTTFEDVGEVMSAVCVSAIERPSPYKPWPKEMRLAAGGPYRSVRFTFYYD